MLPSCSLSRCDWCICHSVGNLNEQWIHGCCAQFCFPEMRCSERIPGSLAGCCCWPPVDHVPRIYCSPPEGRKRVKRDCKPTRKPTTNSLSCLQELGFKQIGSVFPTFSWSGRRNLKYQVPYVLALWSNYLMESNEAILRHSSNYCFTRVYHQHM